MKSWLTVPLLAGPVLLLAGGCGSGGGTSTGVQAAVTTVKASPFPRKDLKRCPSGAPSPSAGGWGGRVAGISCGAAGHLIQDHFLGDCARLACPGGSNPAAIKSAIPKPFPSAGYGCGSIPLENGEGWTVICNQASRQVVFYDTP
jgi:hypothetical protein